MATQPGARRGDTTPPTVSITAPTAGAQVTDIVNVTANAADNVGVQGVQFYVDGVAPARRTPRRRMGSPGTPARQRTAHTR